MGVCQRHTPNDKKKRVVGDFSPTFYWIVVDIRGKMMKSVTKRKGQAPVNERKFRRRFGDDPRGVSSVITVCGIIAVILGLVIGPILTIYIPMWTKEAEAEHMDDMVKSFSSLRGNINKMMERGSLKAQSNVRMQLGTDLNNLMLPDSTGTLYLRPVSSEINVYNSDNSMDLYAKSFGSIEYAAQNHQYTDQRYVYENGAVIFEQSGKNTMGQVPEMDIQRNVGGRLLLEDNNVYGNLPGYDTSHPRAVYYNFSGATNDASISYEIYNNNKYLYEADFDESAELNKWNPRINDWFIESELDRTDVIAKWSFSETQGESYEETSSSLNVLPGGFFGDATHTVGKYGSGLEVKAASKSRVTVGNTAELQITGPHTIECWLFPYNTSGSSFGISKLKDASKSGYGLYLANGEIRYSLGDGTNIVSLQSSGANIATHEWTHIAGAWDGSKMYIYKSGQEIGNQVFNGPLTFNTFKLVLGANQDENGNFYDGKLDEVILTSGAKSSFDLTDGILSVRGDTQGKPEECMATLEQFDNWVADENSQNWQYRKKITIKSSQVTGDHTNFPVLISFTDQDLKNKARSDGYDIIFTDSDKVTRLDHEIEDYTSSTGSLLVWVKVPQLSSTTDTDIYLYYGNSAIASPSEYPGGVWGSNYVGVWHLDEEQAGTGNSNLYQDSTLLDNDGDDYVSATGQNGKINYGQQFSGSGDYIQVAHDDSLNIQGPMTISFWLYPTQSTSTWNRIVEKGTWGYQTSYYFGCGNGANDLTFYLSNNAVFDTPNNILSVNTWQHAAVSYDSNGDAVLLLNGVQAATGSYTGAITGNTDTLHISYSDSSFDFPGYLDEIRISDIGRSANWIKTEFNNQNNPSNFYTVGSEDNYNNLVTFDIARPESDENLIYRKKITIQSSQVTSDLTDFPVLVKLTDADIKIRAQADGSDIHFTASDGETVLDYEIENYTSSTGSIVAWVRVPSISSTTDTIIYLYYGNSEADAVPNPTGVWSNNFKAVWHLTEDPSGTAPQIIDSTSNDNDGTSMGSMTSADQTVGMFDGCIKFGGTDDKINIQPDTSLNIAGNATISGWFKLPSNHDSTTSSRILLEKHISNNYDFTITLAGHDYTYSTVTKGSMVMKTENQLVDGGIRYKYTSRTSWSAGTWYHFVGRIDANNNANNVIFINGVSDIGGNVGAATNADLSFDTDWHFGGGNVDTANIPTGVNHSDAYIDELRIASGIRSNAWIDAEYKNQNNPGNFYTTGIEEAVYRNDSAVVVEVQALTNNYDQDENAFIVFDYISDTDYKYAGLRADDDKWVIGHRTSSGYTDEASLTETIDVNTWYNITIYIDQDTVRLYSNGVFKTYYTFTALSWGKFGLGNDDSHSHFDNLKIYYKRNNGIQIWVNNRLLDYTKQTELDKWDGPYDKFIPGDWLYPDKQNVIKFKNAYSPSKIWAVRDVKIKGHPRELSISLITLDCREKTIGGSGSHTLKTKLLRYEMNEYELLKRNVTLEITTRYYDAWWNFLNDKLNETATNLVWDIDPLTSDYLLWSEPNAGDTRTIYMMIKRVEMLSCRIAVVEVSVD
jgi:hypothetical protein